MGAMTQAEFLQMREDKMLKASRYCMCFYEQWNYSLLKYIPNIRRAGRGDNESYNNIIIMADTETSKKPKTSLAYKKYCEVYKHSKKSMREPLTGGYVPFNNHVVAWTISLRAFHKNIVTLWGRKPSEFIDCITNIQANMDGKFTICYFHNMAYDWVFLRQYLLMEYGTPDHQLNTKAHYPIYINWSDRGLILKDSLILAQRSLDKWAKDLEAEHQKAVGKWDYDKLRNQNEKFSQDELEYIEHDTLAGVECLDITMQMLHKHIYSIPYTATGIPREEVRKRGKPHRARDKFLRQVLTFDQYCKMLNIYHGGFTHANRHFINVNINVNEDGLVKGYDFASSYPYCLIAFKYPAEAFRPLSKNLSIHSIIEDRENFAYAFKFIATNIRLKSDDVPMTALQFSKCTETLNAILDNGRILCASYVEIYLTEMDAAVIESMYTWDKHVCTEIEIAVKDYLPRWFTDYVFELFRDKTMLKKSDPINYMLAKQKLNSLYGMWVQRSIRPNMIENYITGEYTEEVQNCEELYQKYVDNHNSILNYQVGVWVTAYAFYNLFSLISCCSTPIYSDTDSCYGIGWNMEKVNAYNEGCKEKIRNNGYGPVDFDNREYWLGVAEHEEGKDDYTEFKVMGAKRYCGRCVKDGELHITVAGVPKKGAVCLNDKISNFAPGLVFNGTKTEKMMHTYFFNEAYIDEDGNETGDSIDLSPCDYLLDRTDVVDWEELFYHDIELQVPIEEGVRDHALL